MTYIDFNGDNLSKFALGTVQFGLDYGIANDEGQVSQDEARKITEFLLKKGINVFDTASGYGTSEKVLGMILPQNNDIFIVTKTKTDDLNENVLQNSLKYLKRKKIFALLLHDCKALFQWNNKIEKEILNFKSKYFKYFGVSIYTNEEFQMAVENKYIDIIQIPFNIFDQRAIKHDWIQQAKENNKLLIIRSVFLQGLLLMDMDKLPKNLIEAKIYLEKLNDISNNLNISKMQLAFSFVNKYIKKGIILFGCDNLIQAKQNIESIEKIENLDTIELVNIFSDIKENIYNPTKWNN